MRRARIIGAVTDARPDLDPAPFASAVRPG
jgi:hypothetical protein